MRNERYIEFILFKNIYVNKRRYENRNEFVGKKGGV